MTLDCGNDGIALIVGHAGFISSNLKGSLKGSFKGFYRGSILLQLWGFRVHYDSCWVQRLQLIIRMGFGPLSSISISISMRGIPKE